MMTYTKFFQRLQSFCFLVTTCNILKFSRKVNFKYDDYENIQKATLNPNFKGALVSSNDEIVHLNRINHRNFTYNVCNEVILTVPVVFYTHKNSYLAKIFDEKIDLLKSAGLIDYWISKYVDPKYLRFKTKDPPPSTLSFQELLGAFQFFFVGSLFSIALFLIEVCFDKFRKRM